MRLIRLIIILLIASYGLTANGQIQKGYVKTKGRMLNGKHIPGQGLPGSTVKIQGGNSIGVRNTNGSFSFIVPKKNYMVESVQKKGYELVDVDATKKLYQQSANPIYLVMETPEQQRSDILAAERKIRHYLQQQLTQKEDEIEALKTTKAEKDSLFCILYQRQTENEKLIAEMAKRYSTLDYDQLDEFYQKVSWFIENGELTHADSLLRTRGDIHTQVQNILQQGQAILEQENQLQQAKTVHQADIEEVARRCDSFFKAFSVMNLTDSAVYYIELRAKLDSTNAEWQNAAGEYIWDYYRSSNYMLAWEYFNRALHYSVEGSPISISVCCNLGKVLTYVNKYTMAMRSLNLALEMALDLKEKDNPIIPVIYNSIGDLFTKLEIYQDAILNYKKALDLYTKIYGKKHEHVARTFYNIGKIFYLTEDYYNALEYELKALEIISKIDNISSKFVLMDIYSLIGDIYQEKKDESIAYDYWYKSNEIRTGLYSNDFFYRKNHIGSVLHSSTKRLHEKEEEEDNLQELLRLLFENGLD